MQAFCRSECAVHPCPQLVLASCTALIAGGGITTERIFKHNPPPELVDRLAAAAGGQWCKHTAAEALQCVRPSCWCQVTCSSMHTYLASVVGMVMYGPSPHSHQHVVVLLLTLACCCSTGSLSLLPPGASPHAIAGLLKRFLLGLPEPLLTYRYASTQSIAIFVPSRTMAMARMILASQQCVAEAASCLSSEHLNSNWLRRMRTSCADVRVCRTLCLLVHHVAGCCRSGSLRGTTLPPAKPCCHSCQQQMQEL
jgi:hypothetical protein